MTLYPLTLDEIQEALFWPVMKDCLTQWGEYFELAVPATLMMCFEWWCFEILILLSGYIGVDQLSANVILMNVAYIYLMIGYGTAEALSTLVGNCIGANQVVLGKKVTILTITVGAAFALLISFLLIIFKTQIAYFYTKEPEVVLIVIGSLTIVSIEVFFNCIGNFCGGALRSLGK